MPKMFSSLTRKVASALGGLALLVASERADAKIIEVYPSASSIPINEAIKSSSEGDAIVFNKGKEDYGLEQYGFYIFLGDRDYVFNDGVTIKSHDNEGGVIYKVVGSNVNIIGNGTVRMESPMIGIFGDINYPAITNVNVSGIISTADTHYLWLNSPIRHKEDRTAPDIKFSNMVLNGGTIGFNFTASTPPIDAKTPYLSIENITANSVGATAEGKLTAIPKTGPPGNRIFIDMQHYIKNNVLINTVGITDPGDYILFNTPENLAQKDVTNPYTLGINNFVRNDMQFLPRTVPSPYIPSHGSPLNLGDGKYIGAYVPEGSAVISSASFSITPQNDLHTKLRTVDLQVDFSGNKISLLNPKNPEQQKTDIKYRVEYLVDDHNPSTTDTVLSSAKYHFTFLNSNEIAALTSPELPTSLVDPKSQDPVPLTIGGEGDWDIEAIIKDWTSGELHGDNFDYLQTKTISPPDLYSQELSIPAGTWDIYARITNLAPGTPEDIDPDNFNNYVQFAPFESDRITVTGLPDPATLGLLAAGVLPTLVGWLLRRRKEQDELADKCSEWGPRRK